MKRPVVRDFKWGFYCLDPHTAQKVFELKGVSTREVDRLFKMALRKFK